MTASKQRGLAARRRRDETCRAHRDLADAAAVFLARNLQEKVTLADIGRAVFSSPFHLARIFRQQTGMSLHARLTQLRLRLALDQIADGIQDLTMLALEVGFSGHAHFTHAFREAFGLPPSELRRQLSAAKLGKMSRRAGPIWKALREI